MNEENALNFKQVQFVQEYLVDFNATNAYIRVYPDCTEESANASASRLLVNVKVQEAIEEGTQDKIKRIQITQDKVLNELALIGFQNIKNLYDEEGNLIPVHLLPDDVAKTIQSIEIQEMAGDAAIGGDTGIKHIAMHTKKVKLHDKKGALTDYGKHLGLFPNKFEHTGKGDGPIQTEIIQTIVDPKESKE